MLILKKPKLNTEPTSVIFQTAPVGYYLHQVMLMRIPTKQDRNNVWYARLEFAFLMTILRAGTKFLLWACYWTATPSSG